MITDFDDFVTWMYVLIDGIWQQIGHLYRRPGPEHVCSNAISFQDLSLHRLNLRRRKQNGSF